jgi:hypothetical protein
MARGIYVPNEAGGVITMAQQQIAASTEMALAVDPVRVLQRE